MSVDKLPFNWFDLALLAVLIFGLRQGRKHGLSAELISMFQWLALVFGCAFAYGPLAGMLTSATSVFSTFAANLMAYLTVAAVIAVGFAILKKTAGGKLVGSDAFGGGEFYLGMAAGLLRFTCIAFALLALLNARYYSPAEIKAKMKYDNDVYGSDFFPSLYSIQTQVFEKSFTGPWIKSQLSFLLIKPTAPEKAQLARREFTMP